MVDSQRLILLAEDPDEVVKKLESEVGKEETRRWAKRDFCMCVFGCSDLCFRAVQVRILRNAEHAPWQKGSNWQLPKDMQSMAKCQTCKCPKPGCR